MKKKVLFTGCSGFVGKHLGHRLLSEGYEVVGLTSNRATQDKFDFEMVPLNLFDTLSVRSIVKKHKPTHLLHLAWNTEHGKFWTDASNIKWVSASMFLFEEFTRFGGERAVVAGSCAEYSWDFPCLVENKTPIAPSTIYGMAKATLNELMAQKARDLDLALAWGRIFFLFGPDEQPGRFCQTIVNSIKSKQKAKLSDCNQIRDFLYTKDAARAFVDLLNSDFEGPVNICSGEPLKLKQFANSVAMVFGRPDLLDFGALTTNPLDPPVLYGSNERLIGEIGFEPAFTIESALNDYLS